MVVGLVTRLGTKATTDFCWRDFDVLFILIIQCHIDTNGEVEFRYVNFLHCKKRCISYSSSLLLLTKRKEGRLAHIPGLLIHF